MMPSALRGSASKHGKSGAPRREPRARASVRRKARRGEALRQTRSPWGAAGRPSGASGRPEAVQAHATRFFWNASKFSHFDPALLKKVIS